MLKHVLPRPDTRQQETLNSTPLTVSKIFLGTTFQRGDGERVAGRDIRHKSISRQGKKLAPPTYIETLEEVERVGSGEIVRADLFEARIWPLRSPRTSSDDTGESPRAALGAIVGASSASTALGSEMKNSCRNYWLEFRGPDPLRPLRIEPFRAQGVA